MSNPFEPPATIAATTPEQQLRKDADAALTALVLIPAGMCACYATWPVAFAMMARVWARRRSTPHAPASPEHVLLDRLVRTGIGVTFVCCAGLVVLVAVYVGIFGLVAVRAMQEAGG